MVSPSFRGPEEFRDEAPCRLMPFRFGALSRERVLLTNQGGEYAIISRGDFQSLVSGGLPQNEKLYFDLKTKGFLAHELGDISLRVAASQWRTKKAFLEKGPKLHIFVPTLRCNQSCGYCQASRADSHACGVDMTHEAASRAIDLMLASPTLSPTMEFQGGEPLLAFPLVRWMVNTANERAAKVGKSVSYVICTNLTLLDDEHIAFFKEHRIAVSTSVDGPSGIHDRNRPLSGASAYALVMDNIKRCTTALGADSVSALMTATTASLAIGRQIIDEYVRIGQRSIFLRELNPYGYATKTAKALGYKTSEFVEFYKDTLAYIIELNKCGTFIAEGYATILLKKILTPFGVGFVDLQSPTGEGFGVVLYNHDGRVYASDEGRMLGEMGDHTFQLGHVSDTYNEIYFGETMQCVAAAGVAEALPGCSDCVYVPYCGADPIRHYRTQGDLIGNRPTSSFCQKQKAIFSHIFELLSAADEETMAVLLSWVCPSGQHVPRPAWQC